MTGLPPMPVPCEGGRAQRFKGFARVLGPSWAHLPMVTIGLFGVQIIWSAETSYGLYCFTDISYGLVFWFLLMTASPYLLSLGLSKSNMAVVFVAGPLSGLIMQPLIGNSPSDVAHLLSNPIPISSGFLADNSTSRFGRRRPYMLLGTIICISAMLLLGFTRAVASIFTGWNSSAVSTFSRYLKKKKLTWCITRTII